MDKYIKDRDLKKALEVIVGMKPKILPAILEKNDIVLYNNNLYKYNGESKEVLIVNETEFKKTGIRFKEGNYKLTLLNDIVELYKWMYQNGLNGHKLIADWGDRPKDLGVVGKHDERVWFLSYINSNSSTQLEEYVIDFGVEGIYWDNRNTLFEKLNITKLSDMFTFPIKLGYSFILKNENDENINHKNKKINYWSLFNENKIKPDAPIYRQLEVEFMDIIEHSSNYDDFSKYLNNKTYKFFNVTNARTESYNVLISRFKELENHHIKEILNRSEFSFGVYGKFRKTSYNVLDFNEYKKTKFKFGRTKVSSESSDYRYYLKTNDPINYSENFFRTERFFLPEFIDAYSNDTARQMSVEKNNYGVYIQGKEDGKYELSFKVCLSDRNQHEEVPVYGDMYAYLPDGFRNTVRQANYTYVQWKRKDLINFKLTWKVENGKAKEWELVLLDEEKRNRQGLDNFIRWIQVETFKDYLFLKLFYAVWSVDDAGGWNEWQFAHIIPPFSLEYKGE